jgi:tRNA pseudouridine38-40 synthase
LKPAARVWLGTHDFAAFGTPPRKGGSTQRSVTLAEWDLNGDEWTFEIRADAFLYRMVRRLVFVQVAFGQGRLSLEALTRALEAGSGAGLQDEKQAIPAGIAPPNGLTLVDVCYERLA